MAKRIAILGLMLESNSFAPVTTRADFEQRVYVAGDAILDELRAAESRLPAEMRAFCAKMDELSPWTPAPILFGLVEAGGPLEHGFYLQALAEMRARLEAAKPLDGVYICNHGAMITTGERDPDGAIFSLAREIAGPDAPIVATLDLHGNVSERMVAAADVVVAYRTNPHVDMRERGEEAAAAMAALFQGLRPQKAFLRLPITPPTVTQLTASGPYADLINFGQAQADDEILNVSILGGFAYSDTPKNGLAILVTAKSDPAAAARLAKAIARKAWDEHQRFRPQLTPLDSAIACAAAASRDLSLPALALADVADNPGGGGNGNTTWILAALHEAGVKGAILGVFTDAALAAEAHRLGTGARFHARFNRDVGEDAFTRRFEAEATVVALSDGDCVGRRGFYANRRLSLGKTALIEIDGISVVVISIRTQCADPVFLEMMGLDIAKARVVALKSRGHFRAGFDEFFGPDQIIEVDAPGLTSPILSRFPFKHIPRPAFPIDERVEWTAPD